MPSIVANAPPDPLIDQYEQRLAEKVERWASKHPASYEQIRQGVLFRQHRLVPEAVDPDSPVGQFVERAVREEVRKLNKWPTFLEWKAQQRA